MGADLADMQLTSKFNKGFRFLLCVMDTFSKYAWVVPLKDKKGVGIVNAFQKVLKQSNRKPNKIWVDKGSEYYNLIKKINDKDSKFKVGDHVRISKYKNIFAKGYTPSWSEEIFVIKKIKNSVPWTYVINDLNDEEIIGTLYEKELQKTNQEE